VVILAVPKTARERRFHMEVSARNPNNGKERKLQNTDPEFIV